MQKPIAFVELTMQQLVDALGIDVESVREVIQTPEDRIVGKVTLVVEAAWACAGGKPWPLRYPLEDVPMRVLAAKEP